MGCDIHAFLEIQDQEGKWQSADRYKPNKYYDPDEPGEGPEFEVDDIYSGRDYALFTALAGVRNYGHAVAQIDEPRGLPADTNKYIQKEREGWGCDGHSDSWVLLSELLEFQEKHRTAEYSGMISKEQAEALEQGENPTSWCQGTSDETAVHRTWTEAYSVLYDLVDAIKARVDDEFLNFGSEITEDQAKRTRLVFWFDN